MDTVERLMNRSILSIPHSATIRQAAQLMRDKHIGSLLVEKDGAYVGVVTETDLVRKILAEGVDAEKQTIGSISHTIQHTIDKNQTPQAANDMMRDRGVRHLVVKDGVKIVGILSVRDLLVYFQRINEPKMGVD
ncbi:MAG: CBS domain-containing protein [Nitrospirae bacterium]|nr:CBS domain-containing protein [Nitrospirota bacterium]